MKHEDEENIYETNCEILKTCPPVSYEIIKAKLGQKGPEFVHYVQII